MLVQRSVPGEVENENSTADVITKRTSNDTNEQWINSATLVLCTLKEEQSSLLADNSEKWISFQIK